MPISDLDELEHQTNLLASELYDLKLLIGLEAIQGRLRSESSRRFTRAQRVKASERAADIIVNINALLESSMPVLRKCNRYLLRTHASTVTLGSFPATSYHESVSLLAGEFIAGLICELGMAEGRMTSGVQFDLSQLPSAADLKPKLAHRWPALRRIVESEICFEFNDLVPRLQREITLAQEHLSDSRHADKRSRQSPEDIISNTGALIRDAIKKHGKDASSEALYRQVSGSRGAFFAALKNLEARGEWTGRKRYRSRDMRTDH